MSFRVLGIETSCDETAVALLEDGKLISNRVATQEVHARWGGVVPELASRLHQKTLARMVDESLRDAGWKISDLQGIAATRGPGLIGALLVGFSYAKGLAVAFGIPLVGVNHLEGHLFAVEAAGERLPMPCLGLLVSGGHTELFRIEGFGRYTLLGATLDDAAGEAFDKVGGLLGIPYPAGAQLSMLAREGNPAHYPFAVAQTASPFDFSFSGLKSAAMREIRRLTELGEDGWREDIAASFQDAVVVQLALRMDRALENESYRSVMVGGGVAANQALRKRLASLAERHGVELCVPPIDYCTDNAAMIAYVGYRKLIENAGDSLELEADPNLGLIADTVR